MSPEFVSGWERDPDLFGRTFPMDLRPQAHDIIRTWLFYTVLRAELEHDSLPWTDAAISGFVLDPDRKKMSKSKGNVVTPIEMFQQHSSDAVRYWAASARLGVDARFDEQQMKVGRRLAIKLLNVSRFVLSMEAEPGLVAEPLDVSMLEHLRGVVGEATAALDAYDHAKALEMVERSFWGFCDDYVELVKSRAYGSRGAEAAGSAVATLRLSLDVYLRAFAPFLPYVTEEVWSWWREGSVHRSTWPSLEDLGTWTMLDVNAYAMAATVLGQVRKAKAEAKVSLKTRATEVVVTGTMDQLQALDLTGDDVREAGNIDELRTEPAEDLAVRTTLAPPPVATLA
jgi:valyl-tRNA synthetase